MSKSFVAAVVLLLLPICGIISTSASLAPISPVKTLVDNVAGFAFDYPADWNVSGSPGAGAGFILLSFKPDSVAIEGVPPLGETKVDVSIFENPSDMDVLRKSLTEGVTNLTQEIWQLSASIQAIWIHDTVPATDDIDSADDEMLFKVINGRGIMIQCFGETAPCKTIMRSVRLYPATP